MTTFQDALGNHASQFGRATLASAGREYLWHRASTNRKGGKVRRRQWWGGPCARRRQLFRKGVRARLRLNPERHEGSEKFGRVCWAGEERKLTL